MTGISQRFRFAQQSLQLRAWGIHSQPQLARVKVGQHRRHASHVVGVSVRKRHDIELVNPSRPQVGRDHVFPDIQFRVHPERYSAGVHEQRAALRRNQKNRIALANVNGREFQRLRAGSADVAERRRSRKR